MSPEMLIPALTDLRSFLIHELDQRKFAYIPAPHDKFFHAQNLLGKAVNDRFPEARGDTQEAANCLAAELYTAAVFHLMRVVEHGLRALAAEVHAKPLHRKKFVPITEADWQQIITAIGDAIDDARAKPKSYRLRRSKLNYYSDAADHCEYMKDIWRNDICHAQSLKTQPEAMDALSRVRSFMTFLAKHLQSRKTT